MLCHPSVFVNSKEGGTVRYIKDSSVIAEGTTLMVPFLNLSFIMLSECSVLVVPLGEGGGCDRTMWVIIHRGTVDAISRKRF